MVNVTIYSSTMDPMGLMILVSNCKAPNITTAQDTTVAVQSLGVSEPNLQPAGITKRWDRYLMTHRTNRFCGLYRYFSGSTLLIPSVFSENTGILQLVGGIPTPLKNMKVRWAYYSQYIYIWKTCSKPPTK